MVPAHAYRHARPSFRLALLVEQYPILVAYAMVAVMLYLRPVLALLKLTSSSMLAYASRDASHNCLAVWQKPAIKQLHDANRLQSPSLLMGQVVLLSLSATACRQAEK